MIHEVNHYWVESVDFVTVIEARQELLTESCTHVLLGMSVKHRRDIF